MEMSGVSETPAEDPVKIPVDNVWYLARRSWPFHRSVWRAIGRCLEYGEYTGMVRQIRKEEAELLRFGDQGAVYRVALRDGTRIEIVVKAWPCKHRGPGGQNYDLRRVLHPAPAKPSTPKKKSLAPPSVPVPEPSLPIASAPPPELPAAPPPPPPPAPTPPVLRASTLTLGTKAGSAAELLAERMRPTPLPPRADKPIVPKKKQTRR
jgi:hypothetical protein